MPESIEMIADDPHAPSFGGGATRVLSEHELDGLLEATVSPSDVGHPRAPKQTKRIEALARIEPGASIVVDPSATTPPEPEAAATPEIAATPEAAATPAPELATPPSRSKWRRLAWGALVVIAALAGAAAAAMLLH